MKHKGRGVCRLNDTTTHGGTVTSASGPVIQGRPATLAGDMTHCPQCGGDFAITSDGVGAAHGGRPYAYHNALTACGAQLISSL